MVTSLIEHEQIKTTLPKAREAARLAEKLISLGKKGNLPAARKAQGFLLKHTLIPKVFGVLAHRYAHRPGGYTRIHKFGNREGDNAPHAILELVDNPKDLRLEMTARALGREILGNQISRNAEDTLKNGVRDVATIIEHEKIATKPGFLHEGIGGRLRRLTQENLRKVLRYRPNAGLRDLTTKTEAHIQRLIAEPLSDSKIRDAIEASTGNNKPDGKMLVAAFEESQQKKLRPGSRLLDSDASPLSLTKAGLYKRRNPGLGLPGTGWFSRERTKLRDRERQRI